VSQADLAAEVLKGVDKNWLAYYDGAGVIRRQNESVDYGLAAFTSFQELRGLTTAERAASPGVGKVFQGLKIAFTHTSGALTIYKNDLDVTPILEDHVVEWINKFDIGVAELLAKRVSFSPSQNRLFFNFYDADGERIFAQARNFSPLAKSKYWTVGKADDVIPIYYSKDQSREQLPLLVVTEDCLSAIKISRQNDAMPALSSDLSLTKLKRLARLYGAFLVWLDGDMYHKAQRICRRLQLLGCEAQAVYTPLDPKCYDDVTIGKVLLTGKLE